MLRSAGLSAPSNISTSTSSKAVIGPRRKYDSDDDEIKRYVTGRYIGGAEAIWRHFEFPVHGMSPPVFQLAIHLPNQQPVTYNSILPQDEVVLAIDHQRSTLMAFFDYNVAHPETPPRLYQDFPLFFTWDAQRRIWKLRVWKQV